VVVQAGLLGGRISLNKNVLSFLKRSGTITQGAHLVYVDSIRQLIDRLSVEHLGCEKKCDGDKSHCDGDGSAK
jgi:hypothetical protein